MRFLIAGSIRVATKVARLDCKWVPNGIHSFVDDDGEQVEIINQQNSVRGIRRGTTFYIDHTLWDRPDAHEFYELILTRDPKIIHTEDVFK